MRDSGKWDALHRLSANRLHERIGIMQTTMTQIQTGNDEARTDLQHQFHSLAGIGGTFGYPVITDLARDAKRYAHRTVSLLI